MFSEKKQSVGRTGEKLPEKHVGLPDSTFAYGLCPRCEKQSSFEVAASAPVTFEPGGYTLSPDGTQTPVHVN